MTESCERRNSVWGWAVIWFDTVSVDHLVCTLVIVDLAYSVGEVINDAEDCVGSSPFVGKFLVVTFFDGGGENKYAVSLLEVANGMATLVRWGVISLFLRCE